MICNGSLCIVTVTFSLLDGLSKPERIAERLKECGHQGSALTDHGGVSGCPAFHKALTNKKKGFDLKPILGCEFYVTSRDATLKEPDNRTAHLCVLAKNHQGWKNLMKASSASYMSDVFYRKPRLDIERLGGFGHGEFIAFSGHMGSHLADAFFEQPKLAYNATTYEEAKSLVRKGWSEHLEGWIRRYQAAFGRENFYVEIQLIDMENLPASLVVATGLRWLAKRLNVPTVATADSHYPRHEDAADQRVLLCSALNTTMRRVKMAMQADEEVGLAGFFKSNNYHIPSLDEMMKLHGNHPEELKNSVEIANRCEVYPMGGKTYLPNFGCPDGMDADSYLMKLCLDGMRRKVIGRVASNKLSVYEDRLHKKEFPVIKEAGLSSYFLTVQDYIRYATDVLKSKVGKGRGSGAGSLVSYLVDITRVDPIKHDLIFERFYNAGRNAPGRVAMPDIDSDFTIEARDKVIDYLRSKYGEDKVAQMATFSRMQGRGAIKDVLRALERCSFEEMNQITEHIPDEAAIADQLQEMAEAGEEPSIIRWALENNVEQLKPWAFLTDTGEIDGPLSLEFAQAIRLEGTKRSMGKHASGIIICSETLADIVPMVWDRGAEQMLVGLDMRDAEACGLLKYDILGLRTLDCIQGAENLVRTGRLR